MTWLLRAVSVPYLRQHTLRTALTLVGVAAGVATMVATGAVCDSVFSSFAKAVETAMADADLRVTASGLGLTENVVDQLRALPEVVETGPMVEGFVALPGSEMGVLAVIGIDVLSDPRSREKVREGTIQIPDELAFLTGPGSVVLPEPLAAQLDLELGDSFVVGCPNGRCELTVRGLMPAGGFAALFGGRVAVMDVLGAQEVLGEQDRLDHVDLWFARDAAREPATERVRSLMSGTAWVEDASAAEQRAKHLLMAIRVFLTMAAFLAVVVGFFIVYHTVAASIQQRRQHIAVLNAVGVSRRELLRWLAMETAVIASVAIALGVAAGLLFAHLAVGLFGTVTSAWVPAPTPQVTLTLQTVSLSSGFGLLTALGAMALACRILFSRSTAQQLSAVQVQLARPGSNRAPVVAAISCFVLAGALMLLAPATLPYGWLVSYALLVAMTVMVGFGLLGPVVVREVATAVVWIAKRRSGVALLLAGSNVSRNPASFIVVVTAIVMALASSLASFSLTASLRTSAMTWLTDHYRSDIVLTAEGAFLQILTSPPISNDVVEELRDRSDLRTVQGVRAVEVPYDGMPAVLLAYDPDPEGFSLYDAEWEDVARRFWAGDGLLVSDNLARMRGIVRGDAIELPTAKGSRVFEVLGTFPDYTGSSQLGGMAISRAAYRRLWNDHLLNRVRLWLAPGVSAIDVSRELTGEYLESHGLRALTLDEVRAEIASFIDDAFAVMYALVAVSLLVSFVGVVNFLMTALADRRQEIRAIRGIGVDPAQGFWSIVLEAGLVGVVGAAIGVCAGATVAAIITFHSVPMVTGWLFLFEFPLVPAAVLLAGTILLSAAAGLPSAIMAMRWRPVPEEGAT